MKLVKKTQSNYKNIMKQRKVSGKNKQNKQSEKNQRHKSTVGKLDGTSKGEIGHWTKKKDDGL